MQLELAESTTVTLDASGNGTASLGPTGGNETWTPSNVYVEVSTSVNNAFVKVYAGPSTAAQYAKDSTVDGSTGDSTDKCNVLIRKGSFVWAVWTGGDPGSVATLNVDGQKNVPLCRSPIT